MTDPTRQRSWLRKETYGVLNDIEERVREIQSMEVMLTAELESLEA